MEFSDWDEVSLQGAEPVELLGKSDFSFDWGNAAGGIFPGADRGVSAYGV